ncbi:MAG TPA: glycosyltransferase family A protein [Solirubrobacteraceae bacterium]|nr:glycosyltransferase family A protein [Solirubrobacteraceae bacterium]
MRRPTVGVVVPCYRYADVLEGCVTSVLSQDGVDVRVLVIDDCSPDHTPEVTARLMELDDRVEGRRHAENKGLIATANEGLRWAAEFDYTVLISADDLLVPGALARATSVMRRSPRVGMVYGHAPYAYVGRPLPEPRGRWRGTQTWSGEDWIRSVCRRAHNCISSPEVVVRTSTQQAAGDYDPACYHTSDLNMWLRIAAISDIAYIRGAPQAIYRINPAGMLRSDSSDMLHLRNRQVAFDSFFERCGPLLGDASGLHALARRQLARQALWRASRAYDRNLVDGPDALPVEELVAFAIEVCPEVRRLREWHGLRLRRRLGAGRSLWFVPFIASGAAHRARSHVSRLGWRTRGIWL